jgi:hypothetical protein
MSGYASDMDKSSARIRGHNDAWAGRPRALRASSDERNPVLSDYSAGFAAGSAARYYYDKGYAAGKAAK